MLVEVKSCRHFADLPKRKGLLISVTQSRGGATTHIGSVPDRPLWSPGNGAEKQVDVNILSQFIAGTIPLIFDNRKKENVHAPGLVSVED
jgi:hypothetical protein